MHGTYSKAANQRLSYCGRCWLLPQMPKRVLAFGIAPNTRSVTHSRHHIASLTPWEFAGVVCEVVCCSENPGWAHDHRQTEVKRQERDLGRSWWLAGTGPGTHSLKGGAHLHAVHHPTKPAERSDKNKSKCMKRKAYLLVLPSCAFGGDFNIIFGSVKWRVVISE